MPRRDRGQRVYLAHVVPGLENLAEREIATRLPGATVLQTLKQFDERTSVLMVGHAGSPQSLLDLRTVEDAFALGVESDAVPSGRSGLAAVKEGVAESKALDPAITAALQTRQRKKGKMTFRVIARKAGEHAFRRVDLQHAAERGIRERFPQWRLVEDDAQIEVWVHLVGNLLLTGVRLSDNTMRQRTYRRVNLPAALKPTIAAAMVLLSQPEPEDVFLDPMCGSGTILIERALAGRYELLLGGDLEPGAVRATCENIGPRYKPVEIRQWDARDLPLGDDSISSLVTNMPFGRQIGTTGENRDLYPNVLGEWVRVLREGGRMVLLTSEKQLLRRTAAQRPELVLEQEIPVLVRGYQAAIFVLRKREQDLQAQ